MGQNFIIGRRILTADPQLPKEVTADVSSLKQARTAREVAEAFCKTLKLDVGATGMDAYRVLIAFHNENSGPSEQIKSDTKVNPATMKVPENQAALDAFINFHGLSENRPPNWTPTNQTKSSVQLPDSFEVKRADVVKDPRPPELIDRSRALADRFFCPTRLVGNEFPSAELDKLHAELPTLIPARTAHSKGNDDAYMIEVSHVIEKMGNGSDLDKLEAGFEKFAAPHAAARSALMKLANGIESDSDLKWVYDKLVGVHLGQAGDLKRVKTEDWDGGFTIKSVFVPRPSAEVVGDVRDLINFHSKYKSLETLELALKEAQAQAKGGILNELSDAVASIIR